MPSIRIEEDGTPKSSKRTINFVEGENVTITVTDPGGHDAVDVEIASSGGAAELDYATTSEIADVASTESAGTSDTVARGDHAHAHEAAHINHDTTWAAKGDLIAGTANDTASVLAVTSTAGAYIAKDSAASTGLAWVQPWARSFMPAGAISENVPRVALPTGNNSVLTSGTLHLCAMYLPKDATITSISWVSGVTALSAGTNQWFALYDSAYALLRQTADDTSTAWAANSAKTLNLTSTYTTTSAGMFYVGIMVAAATAPTLRGPLGAAAGVQGIAPIIWGNTTNTGLTTTAPNPATGHAQGAVTGYCYVS
jgi:hypothetical protein